VPVFNGENYLTEALDSLLAQTLADFELIISDNASTDGNQQMRGADVGDLNSSVKHLGLQSQVRWLGRGITVKESQSLEQGVLPTNQGSQQCRK
jgi:GT2 family glycosyltransferase